MSITPILPQKLQSPMSTAQISARVFDGDILSFAPPSMRLVLSRVRQIARESFATQEPRRAHLQYSHAEFLRRAEIAQKRVDTAECKDLFAAAFTDIGMTVDELFWDTLGLRIAPPQKTAAARQNRGFRSHAFVHRDTWGVGLQSQINWWAAVYPLATRRTMGFYPSYWRRPLQNTTAEWSFKEFLASRRQSDGGKAAAYPGAPQATALPDEPIRPFLPKPGELSCFSSSHLHGSIDNATSLTRFSLEIRTLYLPDLQKQNGAPNVDNESRPPLIGIFSAVADNRPLKQCWQPAVQV